MFEKPNFSPAAESAHESNPEEIRRTEIVREVLDSVNEDLLISIYKLHLTRAQCPEKISNHIPTSEIEVVYDEEKNVYGSYHLEHKIEINAASKPEKLALVQVGKMINNGVSVASEEEIESIVEQITKINILQTRIHEGSHALSRTECGAELRGKQEDLRMVTRDLKIGFTEDVQIEDKSGKVLGFDQLFNEINEGVTELFTNQVIAEYLKQKIDIPSSAISLYEKLPDAYKNFSYRENLYSVKYYIEFISIVAEVPPDVVEQAIVRAYLRGEKFLPDEVLEKYYELVGSKSTTEEFMNSVAYISSDGSKMRDYLEQAIKEGLEAEDQARYFEELLDLIDQHFEFNT